MKKLERTQVYLPKKLKLAAERLAKMQGRNLGEYLGEIISKNITATPAKNKKKSDKVSDIKKSKIPKAIREAAGIWEHRDDLDEKFFTDLRKSWNRKHSF